MKRVGKSLMALALALVMSLTLLPVQAMAAEVTAETASDGALLDGYLYQLAGMDIADYERGFDTAGTPAMYAASGNLTAAEQAAYNTLKEQLILIANGQRKDTAIQITGTLPDQTSANKVWQALLADLPYALYWHDKTVGIGYSYIPDNGWKNITFKFAVAAEFRGDSLYTTNIPNVPAAVAAAKQVVSANRGKTDYDKLQAYRQYICDQVSYNFTINKDTAYGNPWQLLWVFDGNASTNVVCEGYAKAFKYLCDLTEESNGWIGSVETLDVTGTMNGDRHMWNVVRINGTNYLADVTNCDQGTVGYPTELFLCGIQTNGSSMYHQDTKTTYIYDTDTRNSFKAADLAVSAEGFDPGAATVPANVKLVSAKVVSGGIQVTWNEADGAVKYRVYRKDAVNTVWKVIATVTGTSYVDKSAAAGVTYSYTVRGVDADGELSPGFDRTGVSATIPKPTVPANVTLGDAKVVSGGIQVTWNEADGAVKYKVYRKDAANTVWKVIAIVTGTSYVDKSAAAGVTYSYTVRGVGADGELSPGFDRTGVSATIPKPTAPANVTLGDAKVVTGGIQVTWNEADGAAKYKVYRKDAANTVWRVIATVTGTSYTDKTAKIGTKYNYTVRGVGADGKTLSPGFDRTGVSATISAPTNVKLVGAKAVNGGIQVTWQQANGAVKYKVYRKDTANTDWKVIATVSSASYVDRTTKIGTKYTYTVRGVAADGKTLSPGYDKTGVSATAAPANVTMGSAKAVNSGIQVTWQRAEDAAKYRVYRKDAANTGWKAIATVSDTSYVDKTAKIGTKYTYTVRGVAADGKTLSPGYDKTGVSATATPARVALVDAKRITTGTKGIQVRWKSAANAQTYNVYRAANPPSGNVPASAWVLVGEKVNALTFKDTTGKSGTLYAYTVRGVAVDGKTLSAAYNKYGVRVTMP
ncbi:MAG: hypothetical protein ACLTY9_08520 [Oscillospiraceae bacterium]